MNSENRTKETELKAGARNHYTNQRPTNKDWGTEV